MDPLDHLVYSKRLRKPKGEITLFNQNAEFIRLPPPPKNSSLKAVRDMMTVKAAMQITGTGMMKSMRKHDKDPLYAIKAYMSLFGLEYDTDFIDKIMKESATLILQQKNSFNRARPIQLAPYFGLDLDVAASTSAKTPSYPSGHTAQAYLVALILGERYPDHRKNFIQAAEECGGGRVMTGLHFPTDHKFGIYYAKRLFKTLKGRTKVEYSKTINLVTKKGGK